MAWLLAPFYDRFVAPAEAASFGGWRQELLADLTGTVVEIGSGTGVNIEHYPAGVDRVIFTEPDPGMRKRLKAKLKSHQDDGSFLPAHAEVRQDHGDSLGVADGSCDAVVAMLVLCTVADPQAVLAEAHRVLSSNGKLVFLEHVAAVERPDRLRWQQRIDPVWKRVAGGCRLTRHTAETIEGAGFKFDEITRESARKTSPLLRATVRGRATPLLADHTDSV